MPKATQNWSNTPSETTSSPSSVRVQCSLTKACYKFKDLVGGFEPDERFGILVMVLDEAADGSFSVRPTFIEEAEFSVKCRLKPAVSPARAGSSASVGPCCISALICLK